MFVSLLVAYLTTTYKLARSANISPFISRYSYATWSRFRLSST